MKVLSERSTIVDIRRSLEQSHTFLQKSIAHTVHFFFFFSFNF